MPSPFPRRLQGDSSFEDRLTALEELVQRRTIIDSLDILPTETSRGTELNLIAEGAPSAPGEPGGVRFYGEWTDRSYPIDAMVVIRGGASAGLYISVEPVSIGSPAPTNPPADPTQAGPWVMLAPGNTLGFW